MRNWIRSNAGWLGYAAAALVTIAVGLAAYATDLFESIEMDTVHTRFQVRGTQDVPSDVVVVGVDDTTFGELDEQWPFPRSMHGDLIAVLDQAGVEAIAYDVQFTEPTELREDNALIRAVDAAATPIVLATIEVNNRGETNIFGGLDLEKLGARAGNSQLPPSSGGVFRRLPYSTRGLESFSVVAHEVASGSEVDPGKFEPGGAWIDYAGPAGTISTYSFSQVLSGDVPAEDLAGKTVVVGATSPDLHDLHPTPMGGDELMSGAEIQANAITTVASGFPLGSASGAVNVVLIVVLGMVAPAVSLRLGQWWTLAIALAAGVLFLVGAQLAFNSGSIVTVVYPLLALAVGIVATLAIRQLLTTMQLRRQERIISGELPPGSEFAGHTIVELAGRGGMGVLYRATHKQLGVIRALKMIAPEHAADEEFRERFKRESRMAARIEHPNVIPIHEVGEEDGLLYISMRFIEGSDLGQLIAAEGKLAPRRAAAIVDQVGFALDAAHSAGLVHRDVKPGNLLVEQSARGDHAYLTDFGLSKSTGETSLTATGMVVGTIDYMPPEQFTEQGADPRADVYALGCVLYRALTGRVPFERDSYQAKVFAHMSADPPKPTESVPGLPEELDRVVARAMAKDPRQRYRTTGELGRASLEAVEGGTTADLERASEAAEELEAKWTEITAAEGHETAPRKDRDEAG